MVAHETSNYGPSGVGFAETVKRDSIIASAGEGAVGPVCAGVRVGFFSVSC